MKTKTVYEFENGDIISGATDIGYAVVWVKIDNVWYGSSGNTAKPEALETLYATHQQYGGGVEWQYKGNAFRSDEVVF